MMSSVGTVARRVYRDAAGREAKVIYYSSRELRMIRPFQEDGLFITSIHVFQRDGEGREAQEEWFAPDMRLQHVWVTEHRSGNRAVWTRLDAKGKMAYQVRYENGRSVTCLYFDGRERLAAVSGIPPRHTGLVHGWGKPAGGISCGVAFSKESRAVGELDFLVTLRNENPDTASAVTGLQYEVVRLEFRDAAEAIVPQNTAYIERRHKELRQMNRAPYTATQKVYAGEAMHVAHYELKEWYGHLPPGAYSLTIAWRGPEDGFPYVSNAAPVRVIAQK